MNKLPFLLTISVASIILAGLARSVRNDVFSPKTKDKLLFYDTIEKDGTLYQTWERIRDSSIRGEIRPYTDWHGIPKKDWPVMLSEGFIYYDINPDAKVGRIVDIMTTVRRRGLGTMLVLLAEDRMRHYGVTKIGGSAHPSQLGARSFWSELGYKFQDSEMEKALYRGNK